VKTLGSVICLALAIGFATVAVAPQVDAETEAPAPRSNPNCVVAPICTGANCGEAAMFCVGTNCLDSVTVLSGEITTWWAPVGKTCPTYSTKKSCEAAHGTCSERRGTAEPACLAASFSFDGSF
jgi:hypothetical protein